MICDAYKKTGQFQKMESKIKSDEQLINNSQLMDNSVPLNSRVYKQGIWTQFRLLLWRSVLVDLRDPMMTVARIFNTLVRIFSY